MAILDRASLKVDTDGLRHITIVLIDTEHSRTNNLYIDLNDLIGKEVVILEQNPINKEEAINITNTVQRYFKENPSKKEVEIIKRYVKKEGYVIEEEFIKREIRNSISELEI